MNELVTIIIPTYKRSVKYLSRAIESVCKQSYPNIEIIVIDDSPDTYEHRSEIKAYIESISLKRILYIQNKKNIGGSLSRNLGIEKAQGSYITFLDDDDEYKEQKVEKQLYFMLENNCDLSFSNMIMYSTDGRVVDYREYKDIPSFCNEQLLKYHLTKHLTGTPTFMFKTEKLKGIGGFDNVKMGQEFFLMLKSIERGLSIRYFNDCDVMVYKHEDGGISQGNNKILGEKNLYQFKKKYFRILSFREVMYLRFRHWAVMVVAYKRNHMYIRMIVAGITAFFVSPIDFITEVLKYIPKVLRSK